MGQAVRSPRDVDAYLAGNSGTFKQVPIGVFLQGLRFEDADTVQLSGYIWQKIPADSTVTPGVVLPEAGDAYMAADDPV